MLSPLVAQAEGPTDPDLTVPILVIIVCAVLIVVTLIVQRVRHRREHRIATRPELEAWQLDGGRLLDQWVTEVDAEVQARRTSPYPDTVTRSDDPLGLDRAIKDCPDARLGTLIDELRVAGTTLLATVREQDPNGPEAAMAEARFQDVKSRTGAHLRPSGVPGIPQ